MAFSVSDKGWIEISDHDGDKLTVYTFTRDQDLVVTIDDKDGVEQGKVYVDADSLRALLEELAKRFS